MLLNVIKNKNIFLVFFLITLMPIDAYSASPLDSFNSKVEYTVGKTGSEVCYKVNKILDGMKKRYDAMVDTMVDTLIPNEDFAEWLDLCMKGIFKPGFSLDLGVPLADIACKYIQKKS